MRDHWQRVRFYIPDLEDETFLGQAEVTAHDQNGNYRERNGFLESSEGGVAAATADWWKLRQQPSSARATKLIPTLTVWICRNWLPVMFLIFLLASELVLHRP